MPEEGKSIINQTPLQFDESWQWSPEAKMLKRIGDQLEQLNTNLEKLIGEFVE